MTDLTSLYPGDRVVTSAAVIVTTVFLTAASALFVSLVVRRRPALRHTVLASALFGILASPLTAVLFRTSGTSTFAWSLLPSAGNGQSRPVRLDGDLSTAGPLEDRIANGTRPTFACPPTHSPSLNAENATSACPTAACRTPTAQKETAVAVGPAAPTDVAGHGALIRRGLTAIFLLWLLGSVMLLARVAYTSVRVWAIRRSGRPLATHLPEAVVDEISRCSGAERLPAILISKCVRSPVAMGLFRGAVLLPVNLPKRITTRQLCDVLVHECAHVARRDPLILFLQAVAGSLFWPIPLVHWLNRQLSRVREDLCDNYVLAARSPFEYAETLLRVAELGDSWRRSFAFVGMLHGHGELETRIASVIDERRNKATRPGRLAAALCLVAFLFAGAAASGITIDAQASDALPADPAKAPASPPPAKSPAAQSPSAKAPAASASPKVAADSGEIRHIKIWWALGGQIGDAFVRQVERFNQSQGRIVVEARLIRGVGALSRALATGFQKGELPDAAIVEVHSIASLAARNEIEPLDRFIKDDRTFRPGDLMTGMLTNLRYRGKTYALPTSRSTPILYYNKDRFTAAGLDPDKPPRTWEEVRDMSETLSSRDSRHYGFQVSASPWIFESMVWSAGGELIVGGKSKFAEAGAKPLQLLADMVHRDKSARFGSAGDVYSKFFSGNAAMVVESTAVLQTFASRCSFKVGTAPLPDSEGFKSIVPMGGAAAVIPAPNSAERKAAAWEFLTWLIQTNEAATWSRETGYIPVRESARALLEKDGFYREHPGFETAIKELPFARESPQLLKWGSFAKIIDEATSAILRYNSPALETLKAAEQHVDELLKSTGDSKR